jgi:hypothetical protein
MALWAPCRRLDCPECGLVCRDLWTATVIVRLTNHEYQKPDSKIYIYYCDPGRKWFNAASNIRYKNGEYIRLRGALLDLVAATVEPPAGTADAQTVTHQQAIERLTAMITSMPAMREKMFFSSHGWKLLSDPKRQKQGWLPLGEFAGEDDAVQRIVEARRLSYKRFSTRGGWWGHRGTIINLRDECTATHLQEEIQDGQVWPYEPDTPPDPRSVAEQVAVDFPLHL